MDGRTDFEDLMKMFVILLHTNVGVAQEKKTLEKNVIFRIGNNMLFVVQSSQPTNQHHHHHFHQQCSLISAATANKQTEDLI